MSITNKLKAALIQSELFWENSDKNRSQFENKINNLPSDIELIVLPEMFTTGFTMNANKVFEEMNGKTINWMQKLAKKNQFAITGSIIIKENDCYFNRLLFVHPSGKIDFYDKKHLLS